MHPILLALATLSSHAGGPSLQPTEREPVCLVREYTREHLERNPKQKLSAIYVKLASKTFEGEDHAKYQYYAAHVVGRSNGNFYGNDGAGCTFAADGSVKCQVDCDGGSFGLTPRPGAALMQVTKGYYFPLFLNGADPEKTRPGDTLSLQGDDGDNSSYLLRNVDVEQCDRAIREMRQADFGC